MIEKYKISKSLPVLGFKACFKHLPWSQTEIIILVSLFLCLVYFYGSISARPDVGISLKSLSKKGQDQEFTPSVEINAEFVDNLIRKHHERALFKSFEKPAPVIESKPKISTGPSISQKIKEINLLGVIEGEPLQAIIEDLKSKEVFYITKGDQMLDFEILDVSKNGVSLKYQEETATLQ